MERILTPIKGNSVDFKEEDAHTNATKKYYSIPYLTLAAFLQSFGTNYKI